VLQITWGCTNLERSDHSYQTDACGVGNQINCIVKPFSFIEKASTAGCPFQQFVPPIATHGNPPSVENIGRTSLTSIVWCAYQQHSENIGRTSLTSNLIFALQALTAFPSQQAWVTFPENIDRLILALNLFSMSKSNLWLPPFLYSIYQPENYSLHF
jgi:hypothetical protein